jgi:hypothetical protein
VFLEAADDGTPDPLAETSVGLAGITSVAVQGRSALGPRAGARVLQLGRVPGAPWVSSTGARQAHLEGFDLHANVAVAANNRDGLEQLARYVLRPPIAQERLSRTPDGRVLLTLKAEWSDGTTHLLFEPIELLERLAALTPRPRINLVLHHGVLAPHSRWRARAVAYGRGTLGVVSPDAAVARGSAAPPVPSSAPPSDGGHEASAASQRDPVVPLGGHQSEPPSSPPGTSSDPGTCASVEAPPPPPGAEVVVAGADAAHVRGGRVGLRPVWRPDARRSHRGPRRHPPDSHPPRAPDRSVNAPTAALRPVRLELTEPVHRCRLSRGDTRGVVRPARYGAYPPPQSGSRRQLQPPGKARGAPARASCAALLRNRRKRGERPS